MFFLSSSQLITSLTYIMTMHNLRLFGKFQTVSYPQLRRSNSINTLPRKLRFPAQAKSLQSSGMNPTLGKSHESVICENYDKMDLPDGMKVIFVSADIMQWNKTLDNVLDGLPQAMAENGHKVMVVTPMYSHKDAWDTGYRAEIDVGNRYETVRFFHRYERGVNHVFVDHSVFLEKGWGMTGGMICDSITDTEGRDAQLCLVLLCLAALEAPRILKFRNQKFSGPYGEDVMFVCNDWHTALLPCYLKSLYQPFGVYANAKVAFVIHDMASQGIFPIDHFAVLNLPDRFRTSFEFTTGYEEETQINFMKAGIQECHQLLTASPYHAEELCSGDECGIQLGQFIKKKQPAIQGIINGIDVNEWNPAVDRFIVANYDATTVNITKPLNKEALQYATGLPINRNIPLIVFIGRLEEKNGPDILAAATPHLLDENVQLIILGTGKRKFDLLFEEIESNYPEKVRILISFTAAWVHHVIAGADLLVMPSRSEPCGFTHLLGMQYGTLPVVSCTGGLMDTVADGITGFHMGRFSTKHNEVDPSDASKVATTLKHAIKIMGTPLHKEMIKICMELDLSWKGPAKEWERVLLSLHVEGKEFGIDGGDAGSCGKTQGQ